MDRDSLKAEQKRNFISPTFASIKVIDLTSLIVKGFHNPPKTEAYPQLVAQGCGDRNVLRDL